MKLVLCGWLFSSNEYLRNKVGPGFCPEKRCLWQSTAAPLGGGGLPKAMLAVVLTDDTSLASPQAAQLVRSVVRPLPTETAFAGFRREPCYGRELSPSVINSSRFLKHGGNSWQIPRWGVYPAEAETADKSSPVASQGSIGSTPGVSTLSARCSSMMRFPLLRRR